MKRCYWDGKGHCIPIGNWNSIEKTFWKAVFTEIPEPFNFIVTEDCESLPYYGKSVVVILKSDEFCSEVRYSSKVRAVFRNYYSQKHRREERVFFLPLPYLGYEDLGCLEDRRDIDVFFAGQVTHPLRERFYALVKQFGSRNRHLNIVMRRNDEFRSGFSSCEYFSLLERSKIALCPSGAADETYRHFEALKHGCIVISERLPVVWYFSESPIQELDNWSQFETVIQQLMEDEKLLENLSVAGRSYWNRKHSPKAVAGYIRANLQ